MCVFYILILKYIDHIYKLGELINLNKLFIEKKKPNLSLKIISSKKN